MTWSRWETRLKVKDELIPIVRLGPRQAILVYAFAELGTGKQHAKWQVTSGVGYKYFPSVKIDYQRCDNGGRCIPVCPSTFSNAGREGQSRRRGVLHHVPGLCQSGVCKTKAIKVDGDATRFVFEFETDGSLDAKTALIAALKILEAKFEEFQDLVSALEN